MTTTLPTSPTPIPAADVEPLDRTAAMWRIGLWGIFVVSAVVGTIGMVMRLTDAGYQAVQALPGAKDDRSVCRPA